VLISYLLYGEDVDIIEMALAPVILMQLYLSIKS
jgi:hypothetical protein